MTRRNLCIAAASPAVVLPLRAAVRGDEAMYVGGTISSVPEKTEGRLDLSSETEGRFNAKKGTFGFAYKKITSIEYGQKAGRRIGVALAVNPLFLFSKKRKHFLTIGFADEAGKTQGAVLEIGKGNVRTVLSVLETRSGQKVEYESEDARKHAGN
ncbi:MAG: hypothetical protein SFV51_14540 [Bryobacteraceae bacterium]|nr:hypothetical protein [Bryobacteraceae bacterium]